MSVVGSPSTIFLAWCHGKEGHPDRGAWLDPTLKNLGCMSSQELQTSLQQQGLLQTLGEAVEVTATGRILLQKELGLSELPPTSTWKELGASPHAARVGILSDPNLAATLTQLRPIVLAWFGATPRRDADLQGLVGGRLQCPIEAFITESKAILEGEGFLARKGRGHTLTAAAVREVEGVLKVTLGAKPKWADLRGPIERRLRPPVAPALATVARSYVPLVLLWLLLEPRHEKELAPYLRSDPAVSPGEIHAAIAQLLEEDGLALLPTTGRKPQLALTDRGREAAMGLFGSTTPPKEGLAALLGAVLPRLQGLTDALATSAALQKSEQEARDRASRADERIAGLDAELQAKNKSLEEFQSRCNQSEDRLRKIEEPVPEQARQLGEKIDHLRGELDSLLSDAGKRAYSLAAELERLRRPPAPPTQAVQATQSVQPTQPVRPTQPAQPPQPVPPPRPVPAAGPLTPSTASSPNSDASDIPGFAARVLAAARADTKGRYNNDRVFISQVWQRYQVAHGPGAGCDSFKKLLVTAHQKGWLKLTRADLVEAMDEQEVAASEIRHLNTSFHFVRI